MFQYIVASGIGKSHLDIITICEKFVPKKTKVYSAQHECKSINNHKRFISFPVAVMRLGKKKEKDKEAEIRSVDGIIRLICLSKGQAPLKGWLNIKLIIS